MSGTICKLSIHSGYTSGKKVIPPMIKEEELTVKKETEKTITVYEQGWGNKRLLKDDLCKVGGYGSSEVYFYKEDRANALEALKFRFEQNVEALRIKIERSEQQIRLLSNELEKEGVLK